MAVTATPNQKHAVKCFPLEDRGQSRSASVDVMLSVHSNLAIANHSTKAHRKGKPLSKSTSRHRRTFENNENLGR
jgi:hypothetical protein